MKTLAVYDRKDYEPSWPRYVDTNARAIIFRGGKIALLNHKKGNMYLFPGGAVEGSETLIDALIREVKEETGLIVKHESINEFGIVTLIQKDIEKADSVFEICDYYYTCDVEDFAVEPSLTDGEKEKGYALEFIDIDEAIAVNEINISKGIYFSERATFIMKLVKDVILSGDEM